MNYDEIRKNFYKKYDLVELNKQLDAYINQELDLSEFNDKGKSYNKIINHFFEENIYSAMQRRASKEKSPNDILYENEMLDKIFAFIKTKPNFYTGKDDITNLKTFFRNAGKYASKVANFSPNVARKIYEKYCPKYNANILDYSCGYGSRMLGCLTSKYNYTYYGIDPNTKLYSQLLKLGEFINNKKRCDYKIYCQGSEIAIEELTNKIDLAFSSPPYYNLEIYSKESTQSVIKYPKYDEWVNNYVTNTIKNIYRYLKNGGLFIINVKNITQGKQEPVADDWKRIAIEQGFSLVDIIDMKHQAGKTALGDYKLEHTSQIYKDYKEPLFIFKKGDKENEGN